MATSSAGDLRNFAIVGHASSGKTTLSEAMLACAGVIARMGNVAQGTTVSDCHVSEKQHQISTQTSLLHCTWMGKKLNILESPPPDSDLFSSAESEKNLASRQANWHWLNRANK